MSTIYLDNRLPLMYRRYCVFDDLCRLAKKIQIR